MTQPTYKNFSFSIDDGIATVLMDKAGAKMNSLTPEFGAELNDIVGLVETDPDIKALIIGSAKRNNFLAGADIPWLFSLDDADEAIALLTDGQAMFQRIEDLHTKLGKPVVAAINGACLGGGCELALTASIRIATDNKATVLGQPEVKIGLLPGGGGTYRLPKLVGIATALDLILTGKNVRAAKARRIGLVDEVCPQEVLMDVARARAKAAIGAKTSTPSGLDRLRRLLSPQGIQQLALEETPVGRNLLFSKADEKLLASTGGNYPAPIAALRCIRAGVEQGAEAGSRAELEEFAKLVTSAKAKALMSVFFGSTELKRNTGIDSDALPRKVENVGVLGAGLMGSGIATVNTTKAGVHTRLKDVSDEGITKGLSYIRRVLGKQVKRRWMSKGDADRLMFKVTGSTTYAGFENMDVVIEAVFEDVDLKRSMVAEIEAITPDTTIFATNTSSIPITEIAKGAKRPGNIIGMHYFSPVEKMPLLEVIVTDATEDWVAATCVKLGKRQGLTVIVVRDGAGFYTTRVLSPYMNEVGHLLEEGVSIEAIDTAMVSWGFPIGPITLTDEVGIDVGAKIGKIMHKAFGDRMKPVSGYVALVDDGRHGRKNGRGFYTYTDGKKGGVDDSVYDVIGAADRIDMDTETIQRRLSLLFINEAALCLEEGILRSARDGDIGAIFGLGFPPFRGGPFTHIDQVGAVTIVEQLDDLAAAHGDRYQPAQILRTHAADGTMVRN